MQNRLCPNEVMQHLFDHYGAVPDVERVSSPNVKAGCGNYLNPRSGQHAELACAALDLRDAVPRLRPHVLPQARPPLGGGGTSSGLNVSGPSGAPVLLSAKVDFTGFHATFSGGRPGYCLADECTSALDLRVESLLWLPQPLLGCE